MKINDYLKNFLSISLKSFASKSDWLSSKIYDSNTHKYLTECVCLYRNSCHFYLKTLLISVHFLATFPFRALSHNLAIYTSWRVERISKQQKYNVKVMKRNTTLAQGLKSLPLHHPRSHAVSESLRYEVRLSPSVASKMQVHGSLALRQPSRWRNIIPYQSLSVSLTAPSSIIAGLVSHWKLQHTRIHSRAYDTVQIWS
jgi:hypothetical protein